MGKRTKISTSQDAYKSLDPEKIRAMYAKIVKALEIIGPATYEELAVYMREKPERVWKRMDECRKLGLCHRPGARKIMSSGRQGFLWQAGPEPEPTKKKERVMKGPSVQQFAKAILQPKPSPITIEILF